MPNTFATIKVIKYYILRDLLVVKTSVKAQKKGNSIQ